VFTRLFCRTFEVELNHHLHFLAASVALNTDLHIHFQYTCMTVSGFEISQKIWMLAMCVNKHRVFKRRETRLLHGVFILQCYAGPV
jgi:hypothetical protein